MYLVIGNCVFVTKFFVAVEVNFLVKINPGSNVHGDNITKATGSSPVQGPSIPEPKMVEKDKYQCMICNRVFDSREDYNSHALAQHQEAVTWSDVATRAR